MNRITTMLAALLALGVLAAAQASAQPAEASDEHAMVRFVNTAPNADLDQIMLISTDGDAGGVAIADFGGAGYAGVSEYVAVAAGTYEVLVTLEAVAGADTARVVPAETFDASAGRFYTIALTGLVIPDDIDREDASDDGFMAWLQGLFTNDGADRGTLDLRVIVLDDEATARIESDELHVRVLHAAPGTQAVSLVVNRAADDVDIVETVGYGDASSYTMVDAEGGTLELRTEDGEAVIVDLAGHDFEPGMFHTIVVTGTPVEQVPLEAVVASTEATEVEMAADMRDAEAIETADAETTEAEANRDAEAAETERAEPAVTTPAQPGAVTTTEEDHAMVRFVHAAPNAEAKQITLLTDGDAAAGGVSLEEFAAVDYMDTTDYVAIPAGTYDISISIAMAVDAGMDRLVPAERINARAGNYYTIALIGLVMPDEDRAERNQGFFDWLQGLFTGDAADREHLALRALVLDDDVGARVEQDEARVRIVHAAPGTDSVALVVVGADADRAGDVDVVETAAYGDVSGYSTVNFTRGTFEVRIEGSEAVVVDLADFNLEPGMVHTIFVTGTPVEEVPLDAVVMSTSWAEPQTQTD